MGKRLLGRRLTPGPQALPPPRFSTEAESNSDRSSSPPRGWPHEQQWGKAGNWPEMRNLMPHPGQPAMVSACDNSPREVRDTLTFCNHCSETLQGKAGGCSSTLCSGVSPSPSSCSQLGTYLWAEDPSKKLRTECPTPLPPLPDARY